jgi:hypothetical protein
MNTITRLIGLFILGWALVATTVPSVNGQSFLTNGLVGYYPFAGDTSDQSGNGNNAVSHGAQLATNRFGLSPDSYSVSNGAYIVTTRAVGFPISTNDFTVSVWVSISATFSNTYQGIFANGSLGQFQLVINPTRLAGVPSGSLGFLTGGPGHTNDCNTGIVRWVTNMWYNVQVVRSANALAIYRDNVLLAQSQTSRGNNATGTNVNLFFGSSGNRLYGRLDDIRIYNRALSPSELQQLHDYESGPRVALIKAVKPLFNNLTLGTNYQLQLSGDLTTWTNQGSPFTATSISMIYPQYWDVENWNALFFRLQMSP